MGVVVEESAIVCQHFVWAELAVEVLLVAVVYGVDFYAAVAVFVVA